MNLITEMWNDMKRSRYFEPLSVFAPIIALIAWAVSYRNAHPVGAAAAAPSPPVESAQDHLNASLSALTTFTGLLVVAFIAVVIAVAVLWRETTQMRSDAQRSYGALERLLSERASR